MTEEKPTEPAKVKFRKLECPFDLHTIFTVAVDMENLRGLLEFILEHLGQQKEDLGAVEEKVMTKLMQINK